MQTNKRIWLLESDPKILSVYHEIFGLRYRTETFACLQSLTTRHSPFSPKPDLIVADHEISDATFFDLLDSGRYFPRDVPFVIVSALDDLDVIRASYGKGALEYITKPFRKNELIIKTERILSGTNPGVVASGSRIVLNSLAMTISDRRNHPIQLTMKEYQIFSLLFHAHGKISTRDKLQAALWGNAIVSEKSLDVHIFNLRKKLTVIGVKVVFLSPSSFRLYDTQENGFNGKDLLD